MTAAAELAVVAGRPFVSSWSGGKDSYLAFSRAVAGGGRPRALLCMLRADGRRTHSHALPPALVERQAECLGLPLVTRAADWDGYEAAFLDALAELRGRHGVEVSVFGDIDLQPHRDWVERVSAEAGLVACLPLWDEPRRGLLEELLAQDVSATVVAVDGDRLPTRFLGRRLDPGVIAELEAQGVDACGEEGEYHTVVVDGPLFRAPLAVTRRGTLAIDQYRFADLAVDDQPPLEASPAADTAAAGAPDQDHARPHGPGRSSESSEVSQP
ncbi:MAG TPA: diphthine--ammonia ligase [Thermoleophilia bacterium]|nr:diphthine--ammonia ligase [Thermoleophilia bacterium]